MSKKFASTVNSNYFFPFFIRKTKSQKFNISSIIKLRVNRFDRQRNLNIHRKYCSMSCLIQFYDNVTAMIIFTGEIDCRVLNFNF